MQAAVLPSARVMTRGPALVVACLAALPAVVVVVRGGHDLRIAFVIAGVVGGATLAFAVDDRAHAVFAASPSTRRARLGLRAIPILAAIAGAWMIVMWCANHLGVARPPVGPRVAEATATAGIALAAALLGSRRDPTSAGLAGAVSAVASLLLLAILAMRYDRVPMPGRDDHAARWWLVALVAWIASGWLSRDPAARPVR